MIVQTSSDPLVVIVGATGLQGGSVIKALAASNKNYRIRGLTRDPSKPAAQALSKQGVEMVAAALYADKKDDAIKVFEGADIIFFVTNYFEHLSMEREEAEGKMIVDAAKAVGVKLLVWSGLESLDESSGGKYPHVWHFEGKAHVTKYAKEQGLPLAEVQPAIYMSNFLVNSKPQKQEDGSYIFAGAAPGDSVGPFVDIASDYGLFVQAAIERPEYGSGSLVYAVGEVISWDTLAKQWGEVLGKPAKYVQLTKEQYLQIPFGSDKLAEELYEMFIGGAEYGYYPKEVDISAGQKAVSRAPRTWAEFVKSADWSDALA